MGRVTVIKNDGEGGQIITDLPPNATLEDILKVHDLVCGPDSDCTIRVRRGNESIPAKPDMKLENGDTIAATPRKVTGN